ncbi:MAG: hypothetical protein ACRYGB_04500 [Janthinobacterium lividum]
MNIQTIKINKDQKISDLEFFQMFGLLPNAIYPKTIPGCGFTRYAIQYFLHNLIGILPNVPVIEAKVARHNEDFPDQKILGVYKGITVAMIKEYLKSDVKYKRILSTPEGFMDKVVKAFEDPEEMQQTFFLLYDECERIVTDSSYRGAMAAPLDTLFKFSKKALVSATTLPFTDDRFKDFSYYIIEPTYDYSQPLTLVSTNNVAEAVKKYIDQLDTERVCVFINSTAGIKSIIDNLGIADESVAFCSEDSVLSLRGKGFINARSNFSIEAMRKYNFFTSRYFSAFDIEIEERPDVLMVTDVFFAEHSILDPQTEVIQIVGRLRNGVSSIAHITNYNPKIDFMSKDEAFYYLKGSLDTFEGFIAGHDKAINPGSKKTFNKAIEASEEKRYYSNGKLNYFMVDNFIHENRVKGYYQEAASLKKAYESVSKHFTVTYQDDSYKLEDSELFMMHTKQTKAQKWQFAAELFDQWTSKNGKFAFAPTSMMNKLIGEYNFIYKAYWSIGLEGLEQANYDQVAIEKAVRESDAKSLLRRLAPEVYTFFNENTTYQELEIFTGLQSVYKNIALERKLTSSFIRKFFEAYRTTLKGEKAFSLKQKLF